MKIICTKENLYKGLQITSQISGRNASLPILNNILLKTKEGILQVCATNLEIGIVTSVRGKVIQDGNITVQGRLFNELVSLLPEDKINLELEDFNLKINCVGHRAVIHGLSADDFPMIPEVIKKPQVFVSSEELSEALEQVVLAINPNENRPEISGVLFIGSSKKLVLVATDSYRLTEKTITLNKSLGFEWQTIVPLKTAQQLIRILLFYPQTEISMQLNDNQITWFVDDTIIVSRTITAQFPDYKQIIPSRFVSEAWLDKQIFQQAIKEASLFSRAGINDVRLLIEPDKKTVFISSSSSQIGENSISLSDQKIIGQENQIVFNYHYLIDGLNTIKEKEVYLGIVDSNNPALLKPKEQTDYSYVLMPIRQ